MYSPIAVHQEHAMLQLAFVGPCSQDARSVRRTASNSFTMMVFAHPNILEIGNASTYPRHSRSRLAAMIIHHEFDPVSMKRGCHLTNDITLCCHISVPKKGINLRNRRIGLIRIPTE